MIFLCLEGLQIHHELAPVYYRRLFLAVSFHLLSLVPLRSGPGCTLNLSARNKYLRRFVKSRWLGPTLRVFESVGVGMGLRSLHSDKFTGDVDAAGLWTTLWEPLVKSTISRKCHPSLSHPESWHRGPAYHLTRAFANSCSQNWLSCVSFPCNW